MRFAFASAYNFFVYIGHYSTTLTAYTCAHWVGCLLSERSSSPPHVSEVQVGLSKCTEDCVVIGDHIPPSGNDSKASGTENDEIQSGVVTRLTENVPHLEDGHHSESAVSSDQCMGSTSCLVPEHGDGARLSSEFSADEINKLSVMSLETVTGLSKDGIGNNEDDFSGVERPKAVEEDRSVNDSNVVSKEQIPCEETVSSMEQSEVMFTNSVDHVSSSTKEPVNLLEDKMSCIEKHVCLDETSSNDLFQLASGGSHSEASGIDKPRHQADCASLTPDQLVIPKEMDIDEGLHCTDAGEDLSFDCCPFVLCLRRFFYLVDLVYFGYQTVFMLLVMLIAVTVVKMLSLNTPTWPMSHSYYPDYQNHFLNFMACQLMVPWYI